MFGIYGMGGVGKTTLAKALFNQLVGGGSFKGSCFLANVREASGAFKGLESLQQQLVNDVLRCTTKVEVQNVDQGIKLIEARICSTKVVVVVDDLDDHNHLQFLVGPFASGSVVIITTRDKEILDKIEVETSYQYLVNTLDDADSLALFMRHAFGNAGPSDPLMELSKDILLLAAGLPLALEIFGSHLFNKSEAGWKYYIDKLQRIPNSNIQQRLEISLDALESDDPVLKKVFLDIACFFIGWRKQEVVHIMDSYYSYADNIIVMLKKRCLLTISNGRLGMHDLLQDVGKEIVRNSSPDEPGRRSRLWASKDICDVLKNQNGMKEIECIIYRDGECALDGVTLNADTFKRMRKLRFLKLEKVNLTGSLEQKFEDLRWLNWKHCPLECLPSEFYPQKLAILELTYSNMRTMWELNLVPHVFGNLKTVKMSHSKYLITTPDFTELPCLETLDLGLCESLEEVHMSIGSLARLVSLNLYCCVKLRSLPDTICNLRALKVLNISQCNSLEALPIRLGNIESLTELKAGGPSVSKLPDSIGSLTKLVELDLYRNEKLESLPATIGNLRSLETLCIASCEKLQALPDELWKITRLRKLSASDAKHLLFIPKLPPNLKWIYASSCESLERLPNLSNLKQLEELDLEFCNGLTNIQGLEDLISIRSLWLQGCWGLTHHLPKQLFKVYSEFGRQINVQVPGFMHSDWLDWIAESPYWTIKSNEYPLSGSTTVYAHLLPNESHNFMAIILCFQGPTRMNIPFSVKNTTSGFIWSSVGPDFFIYGSLMVIVPKSIFSVTDDDHRIEFTTHNNVKIVGIHLLYNTKTETIEDVMEKHIDALKLIDPVLPDIFLDIACFFIGIRWQKKRVVQILETYYTNVDHHIDILKTRCLLKINEWNDLDYLEMDDLFQNLGRKLAGSFEESEKLSRLWLSTDIYNALKKHKGTEVIEGIVPRTAHSWDRKDALAGESFTLEAFKKMRKLRFLYLWKVHLHGNFEQTFQELRWLCWDGCPLKCLPSEFYPPKLVMLELPYSKIITMWELNMVPHVYESLKILDMSNSEDLTTIPDFTKLPCLETLNLKGCTSLVEVHISIGSLSRLVSLYLDGCIRLRSLPDTICNLRVLEVLDICDCSLLQALPMPLGNIQSLREFNAGNLTVSVLPDSIGHLSKLVNLRLNSNNNLKTLPNLSNLKQLEVLALTNCIGLTKILDLEVLTSLQELHLGGCNSSLLAYIFTESLFQMYSQFGHPIQICSTKFPDWISQSSEYESTMLLKKSIESDEYCPMSFNLPPNVSHNYLGMILCIRSWDFFTS